MSLDPDKNPGFLRLVRLSVYRMSPVVYFREWAPLTDRRAAMVLWRHANDRLSLAVIGESMKTDRKPNGITQERVRQLEMRAARAMAKAGIADGWVAYRGEADD